MTDKLKPKDIIALAVVLAFVVLKMTGSDGTVNAAFLLIIGYYFAHRKNGDDKGV